MGDRWDRDRYVYERDRERDRDRFDDRREYYEERDRGYSRNVGGRGPRDRSIERYERTTRAYDDDFVRDRRYYEDDRRFGGPAPRRQSPPPQRNYDRRITIEKDREVIRDDSPGPRRPGLLRRQSSLDTFDRRPPARFYDRVVEYGPPARREDYRPPTGVPIPLPRTKGLPAPPPRRIEREYYDEIKVNDPEFYGDEEFHPYPERIREREVIKTSRHKNRRDHSADSRTSRTSRSTRATSRRGRSRSSSSSSSASSTTRSVTTTTITARSEYPKKGKTRIPTRLVSRRALIELGYPFIEEGNTTVILKALGQQNIDELLKLSEDYKRIELETEAARSPPRVIEERREYERREVDFVEPVTNHPPPPPPMSAPPAPSYAPAPVIVDAAPPPAPTVEVVDRRTVVREVSPARSVSTGTWVLDREINREVSDEMVVGPMVLAERPRSRSRTRRDIRAEIKDLQRELKHGRTGSRDLVRAERLPTGEVVLYEEKVEKIEEGYKGVRIEKDKRGKMSISVPKYR